MCVCVCVCVCVRVCVLIIIQVMQSMIALINVHKKQRQAFMDTCAARFPLRSTKSISTQFRKFLEARYLPWPEPADKRGVQVFADFSLSLSFARARSISLSMSVCRCVGC